MTNYHAIAQMIQAHQHFIISSHQNPDGDALGSELGLAYHLLNIGKTVQVLNTDPTPENYRFLDPDKLLQIYSDKYHKTVLEQVEVIIIVDASDGWSRLGRVGKALARCQAKSICIDHHPNTERFTTLCHIDTEAIATAILIFELIQVMQGEITPLLAQALYVGIQTDSGGFRFAKTKAQTHRIAAKLLEAGIDQDKIYRAIYEQNALNQIHLQGYILQNIRLAYKGKVAYVGLSEDVLQQFNLSPYEVHGFGGVGQDIKGVRMSIFAVQLPRQRVKISLRSDGSIPVNQIAFHFGGGGHLPAAGATIEGTLESVMAQVLEKAGTFIHD